MKYTPILVAVLCAVLVTLCCRSAAAAVTHQAKSRSLGPEWRALTNASNQVYAARSAQADVRFTKDGVHYQQGIIQCLKPNYMRLELWSVAVGRASVREDPSQPHEVYFSDGDTYWKIDAQGRMINRPADKDGGNLRYFEWLRDYFAPNELAQQLYQSNRAMNIDWLLHYSPRRSLTSGQNGKVRIVTLFDPSVSKPRLRVVINKAGLMTCIEGTDRMFHCPFELDYNNVRLNVPLTPADFVFHQPRFARAWSKIDPEARRILEHAAAAYQPAGSITASIVGRTRLLGNAPEAVNVPETDTSVKFMRPNDWTWTSASGSPGHTAGDPSFSRMIICDGKAEWEYLNPDHSRYKKSPTYEPLPDTGGLLAPFYTAVARNALYLDDDWDPSYASVRYVGQATWHGMHYRLVKVTRDLSAFAEKTDTTASSTTLFFGDDNLIHRTLTDTAHNDGPTDEVDCSLAALDLHAGLAASDFQFTPPAGAVEFDETPAMQNGTLLRLGTQAPDFTVDDVNKTAVHLSDYKGKVVVLDFWATWCPPCQASLPTTNDIARRFKDQGVVVLGVNVLDSLSAFTAWLPRHKDYDAMQFAIDPMSDAITTQYNIGEIPALFVLGRDGRVAWTEDGFGDASKDSLRKAVQKALE